MESWRCCDCGGEFGDPRAVVVEFGQPLVGGRGPGEHLVDSPASPVESGLGGVPANEPGQHRLPLLGGFEPDAVRASTSST